MSLFVEIVIKGWGYMCKKDEILRVVLSPVKNGIRVCEAIRWRFLDRQLQAKWSTIVEKVAEGSRSSNKCTTDNFVIYFGFTLKETHPSWILEMYDCSLLNNENSNTND